MLGRRSHRRTNSATSLRDVYLDNAGSIFLGAFVALTVVLFATARDSLQIIVGGYLLLTRSVEWVRFA